MAVHEMRLLEHGLSAPVNWVPQERFVADSSPGGRRATWSPPQPSRLPARPPKPLALPTWERTPSVRLPTRSQRLPWLRPSTWVQPMTNFTGNAIT